jgi:hypothetical protein
VAVDTSGRIYDDFSRLLFLHAHREASALALANELQEESEQFRFLRAACYANIKGSVGLILEPLGKASAMRISLFVPVKEVNFVPDRLVVVETLGLLLLGVYSSRVSILYFCTNKESKVSTSGHGGWNAAATCGKAKKFALVKQVLLH